MSLHFVEQSDVTGSQICWARQVVSHNCVTVQVLSAKMFSFGHTRMLMSAALTVWTNNSMLLIVFLVWYVLFSLKAYRLFQWTLLFDHWVTEPTIVTSCNHQDEGWVSFTKEFLCFKHKFANCKCAHNNFQIWTLRAWSKRFSKCWKLCQFVFLSLERQKNKRRC